MDVSRSSDRHLAPLPFIDSSLLSLAVETKGHADLLRTMKELHATAFLDAGSDEATGKNLRENLRGPQGKTGPPGAAGLTGPQVFSPPL